MFIPKRNLRQLVTIDDIMSLIKIHNRIGYYLINFRKCNLTPEEKIYGRHNIQIEESLLLIKEHFSKIIEELRKILF